MRWCSREPRLRGDRPPPQAIPRRLRASPRSDSRPGRRSSRSRRSLTRADRRPPGRARSWSRPRPTRPTRWWTSRRSPSLATAARHRRPPADGGGGQHLPGAALAAAAPARRRPGDLLGDQVPRRAQRRDRRRLPGQRRAMAPVRALRTFMGTMAGPWTGWLLLRSLETLKMRMTAQMKNARYVADFLRDHPKVEPGPLPRPPRAGSIRCTRSTGGSARRPGSLIAFEIRGGEPAAFRFLNALSLVQLAVSLGGTESLAEHPASMTHADVPPDDQRAHGDHAGDGAAVGRGGALRGPDGGRGAGAGAGLRRGTRGSGEACG